MKLISLTKGQKCMVDDSDYNFLSCINWYAERRRNGKFSACNGTFGRMHRLIMSYDPNVEIDHIDGNPLNNQRRNLRLCTHKQNCQNKGKSRRGTSIYHGVYMHPINKNWIARIKPDRKGIHLGSFKDQESVAKAYDAAAKIYFGEFANLNFKDSN